MESFFEYRKLTTVFLIGNLLNVFHDNKLYPVSIIKQDRIAILYVLAV